MNFRSSLVVAVAVAIGSVAAHATPIPAGTVSSAHNFVPTVNLSTDPSTYSAMNGTTFETTATGGLSSASGLMGKLNGTITFSDTIGTTLTSGLPDLFVFNDGKGGVFDFSATSVQTLTFNNKPGVNSAFSLYLLGTTVDTNLGYTATPTSLTISANSTGPSAYSSSATLAIPPAGISPTPEPSSLVLLGTGLVGLAGAARRRFSM